MAAMIPKLIIRADANADIGSGHLMRCMALAQAWNANGGITIFITACDNKKLTGRLRAGGMEVVALQRAYPDKSDLETTTNILKQHSVACSVIDGYHFDDRYQRRIKESGHPLLVIDDTAHLDKYFADFLLNQNIAARQMEYVCPLPTKLLLGPRYGLLRKEFMAWTKFERKIPDVARKLLISFGGSDPNNVTLKALQAVNWLPTAELEVKAVVGASYPYLDLLKSAGNNSTHAIEILRNADNMPELMAWADVAITAGGSTCLELLFMKLPSLTVMTAENQRLTLEKLSEKKIVVNLGHCDHVAPKNIAQVLYRVMGSNSARRKMVERSESIMDGKGAIRVAKTLLSAAG